MGSENVGVGRESVGFGSEEIGAGARVGSGSENAGVAAESVGVGGSPGDLGLMSERGAGEVAVPPGLSQVDPEPLAQVSAEAVDRDATRAAHQDIPEQRERLPVPGRNVP